MSWFVGTILILENGKEKGKGKKKKRKRKKEKGKDQFGMELEVGEDGGCWIKQGSIKGQNWKKQ